ncbi:hypothetical protein M758_10G115200 [Ceratodon purpureus]|nr:hypothetical protein M758_10G115200 [Ceratodon purpureus]
MSFNLELELFNSLTMATNSNIGHLVFVKNSLDRTNTPAWHCRIAAKMSGGNFSPMGRLLRRLSKKGCRSHLSISRHSCSTKSFCAPLWLRNTLCFASNITASLCTSLISPPIVSSASQEVDTPDSIT